MLIAARKNAELKVHVTWKWVVFKTKTKRARKWMYTNVYVCINGVNRWGGTRAVTLDFCCRGFGDLKAAEEEKQSKPIVEVLAGGACVKTAHVKDETKNKTGRRVRVNTSRTKLTSLF